MISKPDSFSCFFSSKSSKIASWGTRNQTTRHPPRPCGLCVKSFDMLILFSLLFLVTCKSSPPPAAVNDVPADGPASFFLSLPDENGIVFIGCAGKRSNPKETLQLALEDAARQVALFNKVSGEFTIVNNTGSGAFDYFHDTSASLDYDIEGSKQYVDSLQFNADTDTLETENTLFVRTRYGSALPFPLGYNPVHVDGRKPDWVDNPPLYIEGYEAGVGYSGRHSSLTDTYKNSSRNAIFDIIRGINAVSESSSTLYQSTDSLFGYKTSNDNTVHSFGILTGFYVLDTWMDPHEKSVWTLAIAIKP
jgi:hypothetical protein